MTGRKSLVGRWSQEPGRTILERVHSFFTDTQMPQHGRDSAELFALLDGLPYRDEIEGGRDLRGAPLGGGTRELDLRNCDFRYAKLTINLVSCDLSGAIFDDATGGDCILLDRLDGASFARAKLRGTFFQGAHAHRCRFDNAALVGASFEEADLTGSTFRGADCKRAKFLRANLVGCDLREAILDGAVLQGLELDGTTDLRGASLMNVYDQELRDQAGNVVAAGTDWTRARVDATTTRSADDSTEAREVIDATLRLIEASQRPWAAPAADELRRARETADSDNAWYTDLLAAVGPESRPEVESLVADAMRSLL
jgi:uncharacterized protein YjbI with pentapeptide repeats